MEQKGIIFFLENVSPYNLLASLKRILSCFQLGEELLFTIGGQHIPFGASPQVANYAVYSLYLSLLSPSHHFDAMVLFIS